MLGRIERKHRRGLRAVAWVLVAAALLARSPRVHAEGDEEPARSAADVARLLSDSFAHVEVALRYDEGEAPTTLSRWGEGGYAALIAQERALEMSGIVLAPDRVLVPDVQVPSRFVSGMTVVFGKQRVAAKPAAWAADRGGVILALDAPLEGAKPLAIDPCAKRPYRAVSHWKDEGLWTTGVASVFGRVEVDEEGKVSANSWSAAVIVDGLGTPVGVSMGDSVTFDGGWKGSPLSWPMVTAEERDRLVARTEATANAGLLRVHVRLRSPKAGRGGDSPFFSRRGEAREDQTERDAVGILVDAKKVLVLASLAAKATARIESIEVHPQAGDAVPAHFVCSFRHFGGLLVEVEKPLPGPLALAATPLRRHRNELLLGARLEMQGEKRVLHCSHYRVSSFEEGWRKQLVPNLGESAAHHFLFDRDGVLLALPIERRLPEREDSGWRRDDVVLLPSEYVVPLLADWAANADPANVPVAAEREGRLAWLGVESQRLDRDLARANNVSQMTQDGESGVLVSYVYPDSPAERAGIEAGAVLLRIYAPDRPKPIDIAGSEDPFSRYRSMFDSMGDDGPFGEMASAIHPWPTVENELNRTLTEIGIGKTITLEYATGGVAKKVEMKVAEGPVHFEAAPLYKSEAIGATVRSVTYEVRRYYQIDPGVPCVIASKIERGGRAAVAGLKRMDIVLRVNDQAVADAAAFGKAVEAGGELRLSVKDKLKERVVKIAAAAK